jgi:hypothetical protein
LLDVWSTPALIATTYGEEAWIVGGNATPLLLQGLAIAGFSSLARCKSVEERLRGDSGGGIIGNRDYQGGCWVCGGCHPGMPLSGALALAVVAAIGF